MIGRREFILYLRPFSTDRIYVRNPFRSGMLLAPSYHVEDAKVPLGALLTRLCDARPLIQFGGSPDQPGPGKIVVQDAFWKDKVRALLPAASAIIVTALYGEATAWETETIIDEGMLAKTAFIIPDSVSFRPDQNASFLKMVHLIRDKGLDFPSEGGDLIVSYGAANRPEIRDLDKRSLRRWLG